jgi:hypothetical protein
LLALLEGLRWGPSKLVMIPCCDVGCCLHAT